MKHSLDHSLIEETRNKILMKRVELDKQTVNTVSKGVSCYLTRDYMQKVAIYLGLELSMRFKQRTEANYAPTNFLP